VAHEDVFGHGQIAKQQQFLVDGRDPGAPRVVRRIEPKRPSVDMNGAGVGLIDPGDDLDQGGFAGAVLA
jgi:hypothetical protein